MRMETQKQTESSSWAFGILSGIFALIYWALGLSLIFVIPAFSDLFNSFGANVPNVTRFVLENRLLIGICILLLYFAQITYLILSYAETRKNGVLKQLYVKFIALIVLGVVLGLVLIGVMYLPLLNMQISS